MCDSIRFKKEPDVGSISQFQDRFKIDARLYGWDGNKEFIDCCMCEIDLQRFFKNHPEYEFYYDCGEWWEGKISADLERKI